MGVLSPAVVGAQSGAAPPPPSPANYEKREFMIPMRDGVKLFTAVYIPKQRPGPGPILLERTPYSAGPYGLTRYRNFRGSPRLRERGYIFAYQDVRGRYMSEGNFVNVRPTLRPGEAGIDESTDTYDTIDFLVKNLPESNGNVGLWGISYPGFYAGAGAINTHPNLKATSPQAPVSDWFVGDDFRHNGALFLQDGFNFLSGFGQTRPAPSPTGVQPGPPIDRGTEGAYQFFLKTGALKNFDPKYLKGRVEFWKDLVENDTYNEFWQRRSLPTHMRNVRAATMTVGGWFDAEDLWGALNLYSHTERQNRRTPNYLVMGPWYHGMWASATGQTFGDLDFASPTARWYQENVELPFFEQYLRNQPAVPRPEATVFETGLNRWWGFDQWPPKDVDRISYFTGPARTLLSSPANRDGSDRYVSDPAAPTPYLAKPETRNRTREYMIDDQRFASRRADVLSYFAPAQSQPVTLAGPITADLWVTTTGTDTDFIVKVIDVWPADSKEVSPRGVPMANYQQLVRFEVMRGKFRESLSQPKPFVPGRPTRVRFTLNDMLHTLRPGHRLMVQIQSSMFPLIDRNPNVFMPIHTASDEDYRAVTVEILRGPKYPSRIDFTRLRSPRGGKLLPLTVTGQ